ncbi:AraC family transcriptional regulator [Ktedonobacter sp. SOSP1-85]|uniref:helix-turn-helix domain-containing protein n=1 Tax=Ktedonobacter sp. SOSP1-85 TaxID=2778367 RepID=UPI0021034CA6|nr:helix-turn-helix domain-containing protein [Ktedonobacter sp. SOSP1-85]
MHQISRFLRATGLPLRTLQAIKRAQHAVNLLQQGVSVLDMVEEAGYFDQPHLTRMLKRFIGQTPAQIARMGKPCAGSDEDPREELQVPRTFCCVPRGAHWQVAVKIRDYLSNSCCFLVRSRQPSQTLVFRYCSLPKCVCHSSCVSEWVNRLFASRIRSSVRHDQKCAPLF